MRIRIPCPRGYSCNMGMCVRGRNQCKNATAAVDN